MSNRLFNSRAYLCGGMDRLSDGGTGWRKWITPKLENRGIVVLDPCNKPIDKGDEGVENREKRYDLIKKKKWDELSRQMRLLRVIDLRMVDLADFIIVYLDPNTHMCGSYEELFLANKQKRPILVMVEGGIEKTPLWLFGVLPWNFLFSSWDDLLEYVRHVDEDEDPYHYKRWTWFKYNEMLPQGTNRTTPSYDQTESVFWCPETKDDE